VIKNLKLKPFLKYNPSVFAINELLFYIDYESKKVKKIEEGEITGIYNLPLLTDSKSKIFWSRTNGQVFILNNNIIYTCSYSKVQLNTA
ncbi:hypothetical protein SB717_36670, partial [Priestia sp. SIMBA_032]